MKKFEYEVVLREIPSKNTELNALEETFDSAGSAGWELVSVVPSGPSMVVCIFKRELFSGILPKQYGNSWEGAADIRS